MTETKTRFAIILVTAVVVVFVSDRIVHSDTRPQAPTAAPTQPPTVPAPVVKHQCVNAIDKTVSCATTAAKSCTTLVASPCYPYGCNAAGTTCSESCSSNKDCAAGTSCNVAAASCVPYGTTCKDGATLLSADGTQESCSPYRCRLGQCQQTCNANNDCTAKAKCTNGRCVKE